MFIKKKKQKRTVPAGCQRVQSLTKEKKISTGILSRAIFVFLTVIFVIACAWVIFFSPFLQINDISLEGVQVLSRDEIMSNIAESYSGKYMGILPKNNLLLFPEQLVMRNLGGRFRKISEIKVERKFPNIVKITIKERDALLVWCSGGPCYIIDENGYAYSGADFESPELQQNNLVVVTNTSAKPVDLGQQVFKKDYIDFINKARTDLAEEQGFDMSGECSTPSALAEEVSCKTKDNVGIFLSMGLPLGETMKTLALFLKKELPDNDRNKLEYLDLRFENRVYYKLKGEQPVENGNSDESMVAGEETSKQESIDSEKKTERKDDKKKN